MSDEGDAGEETRRGRHARLSIEIRSGQHAEAYVDGRDFASHATGLAQPRLPSRFRNRLVVGTVLAACRLRTRPGSSAFGVAVAMSPRSGLAFAWRELFSDAGGHHQATLTANRDHGETMTEERTRNAAVVDHLNGRIRDAGTLIEKQRVMIAQRRSDHPPERRPGLPQGEVEHRERSSRVSGRPYAPVRPS